jgi:hypothetical protein
MEGESITADDVTPGGASEAITAQRAELIVEAKGETTGGRF